MFDVQFFNSNSIRMIYTTHSTHPISNKNLKKKDRFSQIVWLLQQHSGNKHMSANRQAKANLSINTAPSSSDFVPGLRAYEVPRGPQIKSSVHLCERYKEENKKTGSHNHNISS